MTAYRDITVAMAPFNTPGQPRKCCGFFIAFSTGITTPIPSIANITVLHVTFLRKRILSEFAYSIVINLFLNCFQFNQKCSNCSGVFLSNLNILSIALPEEQWKLLKTGEHWPFANFNWTVDHVP